MGETVFDLRASTAALVAGGGLLLMVVLSMVGILFLEGLFVPGDAATTAANIAGNGLAFRLALAAVVLVVALDVVVAWALYVFLRPVSRSGSLLAALFRLVYAAIFASALANLASIPALLDGSGVGSAFEPGQVDALVLSNVTAFQTAWDLGLVFFGIHLLVLGYLAGRSAYVPTIVGLLVALAGAGYVIDSLGVLLLESYTLEVAMVTFVGEVVLLGWLLYRGRTVTRADVDGARPGA